MSPAEARVEEAARRIAILDDILRETHPQVLRARRRQALRRAVAALVSTQGGLLLLALLFAVIWLAAGGRP